MKRFSQFVCVLLAFSLLMAFPVNAAETIDSRGSNYFAYYSTFFEHVSGNKYEIWFDVTAVGEMDELGVKTITVERSTDEVNWTPVATYSMSNNSQMVDKTGTINHVGYVNYTCTSGYYYSAAVELYAKDGNSTATMTVYTTILDLT